VAAGVIPGTRPVTKSEPNANVGLEVGYLMAMNRPVLLLKEKALKSHSRTWQVSYTRSLVSIVQKVTIPEMLEKWLKNYGIGGELPKPPAP
jgi:hypothetical protein